MRSALSKAKGLGSAGEGSHHWWMQRVSAVALIPLVIIGLIMLAKAVSVFGIVPLLASPFYAIATWLLLWTALYHGSLGMQVIYEDYVHNLTARRLCIWGTNALSLVTAAGVLFAVIRVHFG